MGRRRFGVTLLSTPEYYLFSEEEAKAVYYNLIRFIKYKYRNSNYDYSILIGLSNVDGKSVDYKYKSKGVGRPKYEFMLKNKDKGVRIVNWHLHVMVCGAPLGTMVKDIEDKNNHNKKWEDMSYEEKRTFIQSTIEAIYISKMKGTNQQNYKVEIKRIKFKTSRINTFFDLIRKGIIDMYCKNDFGTWSMITINDKKELEDYLDRIRKRYKIKMVEIPIRGDEYKNKKKSQELDNLIESIVNNPKCFKTIKVTRKMNCLKVSLKTKCIFIYA